MLNQPKFKNKKLYLPLLDKVNAFAVEFALLTKLQMKEKTNELKQLVLNGTQTLDGVLPSAFALVKVGCNKVLDLELNEDNILSGILLHTGCVVELMDEIDKQAGIMLASYLHALSGNVVHVALANEFFARRDCEIASKVYTYLGLNVGLGLSSTENSVLKRDVYRSDVIYSTCNQFAVDYLVSNHEPDDKKFFIRKPSFLIIDSADEALIDSSEASFVLPNTDETASYSLNLRDFIRLYSKLSGIASAAVDEAKNFKRLYGLGVERLHQTPSIPRVDYPNVFCKTEVVKYRQVAQEIQSAQDKQRPVVVGIANVEDAHLLSIMLAKKKISHYLLSESNLEERAFTLALAGRKNAVTIISGENFLGSKIFLGGLPSFITEKILFDQGLNRQSPSWASEYKQTLQTQTKIVDQDRDELAANGGLHVIGTSLYSTSRLDAKFRQLANNCSTPGSSKFFISLEDNFLKSIGMERLIDVVNSFTTSKEVLVVSKFWSTFVTRFIDIARNDFLRENPNPIAYLIQKNETGYFVAKNKPYTAQKTGRNVTCPCGSGKKYKKCCGA